MKTPITYYGGKQRLSKFIVSLLPEHRIYCEPFFGGGAVFFAKPKSYLEVINDSNDRLMTFYRIVQNDFKALQAKVVHTLYSERDYLHAREIYYNRVNNPVTDVDVAWSVWVLANFSQNATFHGGWKWDNGGSGSHSGVCARNKRLSFNEELRERLSDVQISSRDALKCIDNRDTPQTVFYLDPPYFNANQKHYSGYTSSDFQVLLERLETLKGKFILSNYKSELIDDYISKNSWRSVELDLTCSIPRRGHVRKTELIITNF